MGEGGRLRRRAKRSVKTRAITKVRPHRGDDPAKIAWMHTLGCMISGEYGVEVHHDRRLGGKATDKRTVPLKDRFHRTGPFSVEKLGRQGFEKHHRISMDEQTASYEAMWQTYREGAAF